MNKTTVIHNQNAPKYPTNQSGNHAGISYRYFLAIVPFILVLLISTSYQQNHNDVKYFERDDFAPEVRDSLRNYLAKVNIGSLSFSPGNHEWDFIKDFYASNGYRPIWIHLRGLDERTDQLIGLIEHANEFGLEPLNYHLDIIREGIKGYNKLNDNSRIFMDFNLEIVLTDAAFRLMFNLHSGYLPLDSVFNTQMAAEFSSILLKGIAEKSISAYIISVEPRFSEYQHLRRAVAGFVAGNSTTSSDTAATKDILYKYNLLALNLDRLRKKSFDPERMLYVNIPAYTLRIFEKNRVADTFRVIVGNPVSPTPVLSGNMETIIANPVWYVPKSIAIDEILPKVKSDTGYLEKHGYCVLDSKFKVVDSKSVNFHDISTTDFNYTFRQKRGEDNSLGKAKFLFTNPYSVYLHDTPSRSLFAKEKRALSHGCVRLQHPERLANYMLSRINSDTTHFENLMGNGVQHEFKLNSALPIHITYITCEAKEDGSLVFYDDIYGLDQKDMELLRPYIKLN